MYKRTYAQLYITALKNLHPDKVFYIVDIFEQNQEFIYYYFLSNGPLLKSLPQTDEQIKEHVKNIGKVSAEKKHDKISKLLF